MGGAASCVEGKGSVREGLGDLPESCVASVLVHLDPPEICGVARLNRAFRGAAAADAVWASKLPENYRHLLDKLEGEDNNKILHLTKKEIYARLSHPIPFDGGSKGLGRRCCFGLTSFLSLFWGSLPKFSSLVLPTTTKCNIKTAARHHPPEQACEFWVQGRTITK